MNLYNQNKRFQFMLSIDVTRINDSINQQVKSTSFQPVNAKTFEPKSCQL